MLKGNELSKIIYLIEFLKFERCQRAFKIEFLTQYFYDSGTQERLHQEKYLKFQVEGNLTPPAILENVQTTQFN